MVRVAAELREALQSILQVGPPDNPALQRLIDSYRDIARELGQQNDVEHTLHDLLPPARSVTRRSQGASAAARHSSRSTSPIQTSRNSPSM